jgi:hypothetical protein
VESYHFYLCRAPNSQAFPSKNLLETPESQFSVQIVG